MRFNEWKQLRGKKRIPLGRRNISEISTTSEGVGRGKKRGDHDPEMLSLDIMVTAAK